MACSQFVLQTYDFHIIVSVKAKLGTRHSISDYLYSTEAFKENATIHKDSIYVNNLVIFPTYKHNIIISNENENSIKMETMNKTFIFGSKI